MATAEILTTLKDQGDRWGYQGQIIHKAKKKAISGVVPKMKTDGMIKDKIIRDVKRQIQEYLASLEPPIIKTLSQDTVFKDTLS